MAAALAVFSPASAAPDKPRSVVAVAAFDKPELSTDGAGATIARLAGCDPLLRTGLPVVPFRTLRLALPAGYTASGVTSRTFSPTITLPGSWRIELARQPASGFPAAEEQAPLATPSPYPAALAELVSVQRLDGYDLALVNVYPLRVSSELGRLEFTAAVAVEVQLAPAATSDIQPAANAEDLSRVASAVDNPEALPFPRPLPAGTPDAAPPHYLLVTREPLLPAFQPLIEQKEAAGFTVHTALMESITNLYAGVDAAERLRTFLRAAFTNWGVRYVLLGGDTKVVPYRGAYARCAGVTWTLLPTDLYFACLDGSWNHDGDALWGEPTDGETGGDVDLLPELYVGRAPVETAVEVTNFVTRCLAAAQYPASQFRACVAGEILDSSGSQGGDALDTLRPALAGSLCPAGWLDDRPQLSPVWSASDALAALNRSPLLAIHFGHGTDYGYSTTAMRLSVPDLVALSNVWPFLLYSTACNTGAFDNNFGMADCIAEELVKRPVHGAFAVVANAREGWYDPADEVRYSGEFQRRFFERLLSAETTSVGAAHQLSKQDLLGHVETYGTSMPYRWCYFGLNLLGDPHALIRVPLSLRFAVMPDARVISWNSWSNVTYSVYRSATLSGGGEQHLASGLSATPPLNVYTDATPAVSRGFYRVVTD